MKILLLDQTKSVNTHLLKELKRWGYEVLIESDEALFFSLLEERADIRIVVIKQSEGGLKEIVMRVRQHRYYTCVLLCGGEAEKKWPSSGGDIFIDGYIDSFENIDALLVLLRNFKQIIQSSSVDFNDLTVLSYQPERQVINMEWALTSVKHDRSQLKQRLDRLVNTVNDGLNSLIPFSSPVWNDVLVESDKMGTEQLTDWLLSIRTVTLDQLRDRLVNVSILRHQSRIILSDLLDGIGCLDSLELFSEKTVKNSIDPLENSRVLLVEDMKYNRVLLKKILEKHNCGIVEAENGEDAIVKWRQGAPFDIIIMDMNMPVMDGFAATKMIREIETENSLKRTPIIALTALAMRGDKEACLEAGTDGYLPKPVEAGSLIKVSEQLLLHGTIAPEENQTSGLKINNILIKSDHQIVYNALAKIFKDLRLEWERNTKMSDILLKLEENKNDVIVLDGNRDLELAYFIKERYPEQNVILILRKKSRFDLLIDQTENYILYPFEPRRVEEVLRRCSEKLKQAESWAEREADIESLSKIKSEIGIEEAIQTSNQQLAVWQKAFRKIGGDLVIGHQFNLHGKYGFILGDVAGHDIQSGYTASWFSGLVKGVWGQNSNPFNLLVYLNNLFAHETEEENKRFVCALALLWDPIRHTLQYANAGIPGGIHVKKNTGKAELIEWKGVPIGMFPDMDMFDFGVIDFKEGDRLIMATDGVLEAIPSEIISGLSESKSDQPPQGALDAIVDFVTRSIEITDDLTIAVFEAKPFPEPQNGYRRQIQSDFEEVDKAIGVLERFLQDSHSDQFDWPLVSVAIREALINAVEHGNKNNRELPIDMDVSLNDGVLNVTISDCGSGFDLSSEKKRLEQEGELRIHGRGIEMMENIGQSVSFTGGGISLRFEPT